MEMTVQEITSPNQNVLVDCDFQTDDYAPSFDCFEIEFTPEIIEKVKKCMLILNENTWMAHICIDVQVLPVSEIDGEFLELEDLRFEAEGLRVYTNCFYAFGQQDHNAQNQYESARMELNENDKIIIVP